MSGYRLRIPQLHFGCYCRRAGHVRIQVKISQHVPHTINLLLNIRQAPAESLGISPTACCGVQVTFRTAVLSRARRPPTSFGTVWNIAIYLSSLALLLFMRVRYIFPGSSTTSWASRLQHCGRADRRRLGFLILRQLSTLVGIKIGWSHGR